MHGFGKGILQIADNIVMGVANAGVTFGFFPDGRDHVEVLPGKGFVTLSFPDHADEGWPAFELRLPESFEFRGAFFSILGRRAHLLSEVSAEKLLDDFKTLAGITLESCPGKGWSATMANGVEVALMQTDSGAVFAVRQNRTAEELEEAMRNRSAAMGRASSDGLCGIRWEWDWSGEAHDAADSAEAAASDAEGEDEADA